MSKSLVLDDVMKRIKGVLPVNKSFIGLHEPHFCGNEWEYVKECIDTGWVSSVGKFVDTLEHRLTEFTGTSFAVAVVNGTAALHICLKLAGVERGDEVLIPTLTFIATANAVTYCGAIPHFIDSEESTLGVDPYKLNDYLLEITDLRVDGCYNRKTGNRIKAIVPMHTFGHPVNLDPLVEISEKYKIELVEDAAESLGSFYKGKHTGNWGKVTALSFNGNKVITTGGGGAVLTNDPVLAKLAKHITTTAKLTHKWSYNHDQIGYNYRMPNINAALGCAQLEQLPIFLEKKFDLTKRYKQAFDDLQGISFFMGPEYSRSNYWLNALILDVQNKDRRDELLELTNNQGIMTRPLWTPMHQLEMFSSCPRMNLEVAESLESRLINIPSSAFL